MSFDRTAPGCPRTTGPRTACRSRRWWRGCRGSSCCPRPGPRPGQRAERHHLGDPGVAHQGQVGGRAAHDGGEEFLVRAVQGAAAPHPRFGVLRVKSFTSSCTTSPSRPKAQKRSAPPSSLAHASAAPAALDAMTQGRKDARTQGCTASTLRHCVVASLRLTRVFPSSLQPSPVNPALLSPCTT